MPLFLFYLSTERLSPSPRCREDDFPLNRSCQRVFLSDAPLPLLLGETSELPAMTSHGNKLSIINQSIGYKGFRVKDSCRRFSIKIWGEGWSGGLDCRKLSITLGFKGFLGAWNGNFGKKWCSKIPSEDWLTKEEVLIDFVSVGFVSHLSFSRMCCVFNLLVLSRKSGKSWTWGIESS